MRRQFALFALALMGFFAAGTVGFAADTGSLIGIRHIRGASLNAQFRTESGNTWTSVQLFAGDELIQFDQTGKPVREGILLLIAQGTLTPFETTRSADCEGEAETFRVGPLLSEASVRGVAVCRDLLTSSTFNVVVDVTARATSELVRVTEHRHELDAGRLFILQLNGAYRDAVASGTVADGSQNFTPDESILGVISRQQDGLFVVEPPGLGG